jgi:hypothetical protein
MALYLKSTILMVALYGEGESVPIWAQRTPHSRL